MEKEKLKESIKLIEENAEILRNYLRLNKEKYENYYWHYIMAKSELNISDFTFLKELLNIK